jgi:hypothetical protein
MKKATTILLLLMAAVTVQGQQKVIKPKFVTPMPKISKAEWERLYEKEDFDEMDYDEKKYGDLSIYDDLYSGKCSWYCGGEVKKVTASSCLAPQGKFTYAGKNAHDFSHESVWATKGKGVGQSLTYTFEGKCPRITAVKILNGHVKTENAWRANSRVKRLRMYYNGKPYAILELQDSRSMQYFPVGTLGYHDPKKPNWTLKFEILDVYPGDKYGDTVISELYFDGIDVH